MAHRAMCTHRVLILINALSIEGVRMFLSAVRLMAKRPIALCARHVMHLGGESSLRAVVTGTASLGKGVHREVGSEGS